MPVNHTPHSFSLSLIHYFTHSSMPVLISMPYHDYKYRYPHCKPPPFLIPQTTPTNTIPLPPSLPPSSFSFLSSSWDTIDTIPALPHNPSSHPFHSPSTHLAPNPTPPPSHDFHPRVPPFQCLTALVVAKIDFPLLYPIPAHLNSGGYTNPLREQEKEARKKFRIGKRKDKFILERPWKEFLWNKRRRVLITAPYRISFFTFPVM